MDQPAAETAARLTVAHGTQHTAHSTAERGTSAATHRGKRHIVAHRAHGSTGRRSTHQHAELGRVLLLGQQQHASHRSIPCRWSLDRGDDGGGGAPG